SGRVRLSNDGKTLICSSGSATVWKWNTGSLTLGNVRAALAWNLSNGELFLPPLLKLSECTPLDSTRAFDCSSGECSVIDLRNGSLLTRNIAKHFKAPNTNNIWVNKSIVHRWVPGSVGQWIAVHQDGGNEILVVDAMTGALTARLDRGRFTNQVITVVIRPDGKQVLAAFGPKQETAVVRWDVGISDKPVEVPTQGWYPFAYTRSGKLAVFDHANLSGFKLFDTDRFREVLAPEWMVQKS